MKLTDVAMAMTILWSNAAADKIPSAVVPLTICFGGSEDVALENRAKAVASDVFARIGVRIRWHNLDKCPEKTIRIELAKSPPADERPDALAYAAPYEGTHIVVFLDRVTNMVRPGNLPNLLGYVIAHEVTHILQGEVRHSESGVMKEKWNADDFRKMGWEALQFAPEDILLIQRGMVGQGHALP